MKIKLEVWSEGINLQQNEIFSGIEQYDFEWRLEYNFKLICIFPYVKNKKYEYHIWKQFE